MAEISSSSCPTRSQLEDLLAGRLSVEEHDVLEKHVLGCDKCQALLNGMHEPADQLSVLREVFTPGRLGEQRPPPSDVAQLKSLTGEPANARIIAEMWVCPSCLTSIDVSTQRPERCPNCGTTLAPAADVTVSQERPHAGASTIVDSSANVLRSIGRYQILRELGHGGFGTVYLAQDPQLNQRVAIKVPKAGRIQSAEFLARFEREGRNAARLREHPGIVTVHDVGQCEGTPYLVFEYVSGEPLHQRLAPSRWRQERQSFREIAQLTAQIAKALEYAHSKNVIHRDVKPSNIMISQDGRPKLMDFGLAKQEDVDVTVTRDGAIVGTPAYMSPQQAAGKIDDLTPQTDIYSLGVVLYQMLTGEIPFRGRSQDVMRQVREDDPTAPRKLDAKIPWELEAICQMAMEKDLTRRYATAGDFAADLENWIQGKPILARPVGAAGRVWRWSRRHPAAAGLVSSVVAMLIVLTISSVAIAALAVRIVDKIKESQSKDRQLLSRAYLDRAWPYLHSWRPMPEYNPLRALPWLFQAMVFDEENPERRAAARLRVQLALEFAPRVQQIVIHKQGIRGTSLSSKGDIFAIGGPDGVVEVRRTSDLQLKIAPFVHPGAVSHVVLSPDASTLAAASGRDVYLWEVGT